MAETEFLAYSGSLAVLDRLSKAPGHCSAAPFKASTTVCLRVSPRAKDLCTLSGYCGFFGRSAACGGLEDSQFTHGRDAGLYEVTKKTEYVRNASKSVLWNERAQRRGTKTLEEQLATNKGPCDGIE